MFTEQRAKRRENCHKEMHTVVGRTCVCAEDENRVDVCVIETHGPCDILVYPPRPFFPLFHLFAPCQKTTVSPPQPSVKGESLVFKSAHSQKERNC